MESLIRKQGGVSIVAPSLEEIPLENNPQAYAFAEKLFQGQVDLLILLTGVGTRTLIDVLKTRYPLPEILSELRKIKIAIRGPKPRLVLSELGLKPDFVAAEPNTWKEILTVLDKDFPLQGKTIAVQEYGVSNQPFLEELERRGGLIFRLPVYRWKLPEDLQPIRQAIQQIVNGEADAVVWTNAQQLHHVIQIARQMGVEDSFHKSMSRLFVASIGPTMSETLHEYGFSVDFEPSQSKMGVFVMELAEQAERIRLKK